MVEAACADGPVEATYSAINKIVGLPVKLETYGISAVTGVLTHREKWQSEYRPTITPLWGADWCGHY